MIELQMPVIDARTRIGRANHPIIDLVSGKIVGRIQGRLGSRFDTFPAWMISLFDGKYSGGFSRREECIAFAKGVEAVLNHMTSIGEESSSTEVA
jgi:hypothetical protein